MPPGTSVVLTVLARATEDGHRHVGRTADLSRGDAIPRHKEPRGTRIPQLGFSVAPKPASGGVVITELNPDGVAAEVGLKVGDVIIEMGGKKVANAK